MGLYSKSEAIKALSNFRLLKGKRIFLTGGTGLFGKWLLDSIASLNDVSNYKIDLVVLSRNPQEFLNSSPQYANLNGISFIGGDVRDFLFPTGKFDYVIHAATPISSDKIPINSQKIYSIIVKGTQQVLAFSKVAEVTRILYISSGAVYGVQPRDILNIPETFPSTPINVYGKGKLISEQLCFDSSIEAVSARCFTFIGPYLPLDAHFAIGNFISNCLRNEDIKITGDGTTLRSYMYASDLMEWLLSILVNGKSGETYNVGSDQERSIQSLASIVRTVAGTKNKITIQQHPDSTQLPTRYVPSTKKARTELGLTLKIDLQDAIQKTLTAYRELDNAY
jgi:nucleoside-diphosphate-sugar epimerase